MNPKEKEDKLGIWGMGVYTSGRTTLLNCVFENEKEDNIVIDEDSMIGNGFSSYIFEKGLKEGKSFRQINSEVKSVTQKNAIVFDSLSSFENAEFDPIEIRQKRIKK